MKDDEMSGGWEKKNQKFSGESKKICGQKLYFFEQIFRDIIL